jgi:hypothetical protein
VIKPGTPSERRSRLMATSRASSIGPQEESVDCEADRTGSAWICFANGFQKWPGPGSASNSVQTVLGSHMIIWVGVKIASTRRSQEWVGMAGMISSSFSRTQTGALDDA